MTGKDRERIENTDSMAPFLWFLSPDNDPLTRKCEADRRDKLTAGVNQRLNHNQEARAGPEEHSIVASVEHCPKSVVSLTPPHTGLLIDKCYFAWPTFIHSSANSTSVFLWGSTLPKAQAFRWLARCPSPERSQDTGWDH
jgi:hypothetical protein